MSKIQKQEDFFDSHKQELLDKYNGQVIVISDDLDITSFSTLEEGYRYGVKKYGYGNFLLKDCSVNIPHIQIISPVITLV